MATRVHSFIANYRAQQPLRRFVVAVVVVLGIQSFLYMQQYRIIGEQLERDLISCLDAP